MADVQGSGISTLGVTMRSFRNRKNLMIAIKRNCPNLNCSSIDDTNLFFSDETFFILVISSLEPDDLGRQGELERNCNICLQHPVLGWVLGVS